VGLTPDAVGGLTTSGHDVVSEAGAATGSAFPDAEYAAVGAKIVDSADEVWGRGKLVLKVKEPVPPEFDRMQRGQIVFTYPHLAASRSCTEGMLERGVTAIAYEAVRDPRGGLPLLAPMSEVAGRLASQVGAEALRTDADSRGMLLGGVPGTPPAKVQGGCFEDSRPTTHEGPTYRVHNSVFYCVANMPGSVPDTSTIALTNATRLPYAGIGWPIWAGRRPYRPIRGWLKAYPRGTANLSANRSARHTASPPFRWPPP